MKSVKESKETTKDTVQQIKPQASGLLEKPGKAGSVALVGAGPGRGTITLRGLETVRSAQIICYDELLDKEILSFAPADCELIPVGKRHGKSSMTQNEITGLLMHKAGEGYRVVRLKGGDSFVFGRGSEEASALKNAGIPFELIPGVSSATAVPEALGIPVTHRGTAPSFTVVTGHGADGSNIDYKTLAKLKGTLLFLMGMHNMSEITNKLIEYGKDPETPAAVLSKGLMPGQQRIDGTLGTIAELAKDAPAPGIILIGEVADMHLQKTYRLPLDDVSIIAAGTPAFTGRLKTALSDKGAYVIRENCLRTEMITAHFPDDLSAFDWIIFTSGNGAAGFFEGLRSHGMDIRDIADKKFACVGSGTAEKLYEYGIRADFIPSQHSAACLGEELPAYNGFASSDNKLPKLLLMLAENASAALPDALDKKSIKYKICTIYRTVAFTASEPSVAAAGKPGLLSAYTNPERHDADYVVFSSQACVREFFRFKDMPDGSSAVCMGSAAANELKHYFDGRLLMAEKAGIPGVVSTIINDHQLK